MSETSTLISCTGKISRAELAQVPTRPSTATHVPIPHAAVVEGLVDKSIHCVIARFPFSMRCRSKSTFTRSASLADSTESSTVQPPSTQSVAETRTKRGSR